MDTIEFKSSGFIPRFTQFALYDANPPKWWQFWKRRWMRTRRHGSLIAYGQLDQTAHDGDTITIELKPPTFTID